VDKLEIVVRLDDALDVLLRVAPVLEALQVGKLPKVIASQSTSGELIGPPGLWLDQYHLTLGANVPEESFQARVPPVQVDPHGYRKAEAHVKVRLKNNGG
jgi:hypothetical protein